MVNFIESDMEVISLVIISAKSALCTKILRHYYNCAILSIRHGQYKFSFNIRDTFIKCCQQLKGNVKFVYYM